MRTKLIRETAITFAPMSDLINKRVYYFLGIGGIGMSALARYFRFRGAEVMGYDRTSTPLTTELQLEGIDIHFDDSVMEIPTLVHRTRKEDIVVVYTPAIPRENSELNWFLERGYTCVKRSGLLGAITDSSRCIAVAGTHGKTTTSSLLAHLLTHSGKGCTAFLGGIATNYGTNLILHPDSDILVAEADEFDRSFLTLSPSLAVITSMDADHLDIYGSADAVEESFRLFSRRLRENGTLLIKQGLPEDPPLAAERPDLRVLSYSISAPADYMADHIRVENGSYRFSLVTPGFTLEDLEVGLPGRHNVENAVAASALALLAGMDPAALRAGLSGFRGVARRFQKMVSRPELVYIDDYAHHPAELSACIRSARELYPGMRLTGIFQPHLYTRTRDFADAFARSLSELDEVILLPIYPARELPIPGIDSQMLLDKIPISSKKLVEKGELLEELRSVDSGVILTMGAGDIDTLTEPLRNLLQ
jgi:UDP-N-acetylmuramate--alanine ligase